MKRKFSHLTTEGKLKMVNVGNKPISHRLATAQAIICFQATTLRLLKQQALPKGNALTCAQVAGIQAAKKTSELIPLCHSLNLDEVQIKFEFKKDCILILATTSCQGKTGAEMEALTAATLAALTLYDMTKAVDKKMSIKDIKLLSKTKTP